VLTGVIWLLEGARLYFVIRALGLPEVGLGISSSVFVALAAALLTVLVLANLVRGRFGHKPLR
jgi:uncharacterized membrane protein YbhN (UPF0104 family)